MTTIMVQLMLAFAFLLKLKPQLQPILPILPQSYLLLLFFLQLLLPISLQSLLPRSFSFQSFPLPWSLFRSVASPTKRRTSFHYYFWLCLSFSLSRFLAHSLNRYFLLSRPALAISLPLVSLVYKLIVFERSVGRLRYSRFDCSCSTYTNELIWGGSTFD